MRKSMITARLGNQSRVLVLTTAGACTVVARQAGGTQYDVTTLPNGVVAYGVDRGNAVGATADQEAILWPLTGAPVIFGGGPAYGISGNEQVGSTGPNPIHAVIWHGTAGSQVDLNPSGASQSVAYATDGTYQGGFVDFDAALWHGSSGFTDLGPGVVRSISAGVQVGYMGGVGSSQALLWNGQAPTVVNLNPSPSVESQALGVSRGQVVGWVLAGSGEPAVEHAALWPRQTASSFVDFNPQFATSSQLAGTNGTQQVGYVTFQPKLGALPPPDDNPAVWHGGRNTFQLLPLPAGYTFGAAAAVDSDGDIVGWVRPVNGEAAAVLWTPHRLPGDANFDGSVGFDDLVALARHYGQSGNQIGFVDGDFDMDGKVDFTDLTILAQHYGQTLPSAQLAQFDRSFRGDVERAFEEVPEPGSLVAASAVVLAMMSRRRRR